MPAAIDCRRVPGLHGRRLAPRPGRDPVRDELYRSRVRHRPGDLSSARFPRRCRDPVPKDRAFLAAVTLTIWLKEDLDLWERAFRRPVWPLRLGRSQDLASARTRRVELTAGPRFPAPSLASRESRQGRPGPAPSDGDQRGPVQDPVETGTGMPRTETPKIAHRRELRHRGRAGSGAAAAGPPGPDHGQDLVPALDQVWAKSRVRSGDPRGELLTEHLIAVTDAARLLRDRTGVIPGLPEYFWDCVILAGLFHDAGKIPQGFQRMVGNPGPETVWGHRHRGLLPRLRPPYPHPSPARAA